MRYSMQKIINRLNLNSHKIFLVDAIGALLSGFGNSLALFISLEKFNLTVTSHQPLLYIISFFMLYSLICYFLFEAVVIGALIYLEASIIKMNGNNY